VARAALALASEWRDERDDGEAQVSHVGRYKCDGCGKEAVSRPSGAPPEGWVSGWLMAESFHGCNVMCLVRAARVVCDKVTPTTVEGRHK